MKREKMDEREGVLVFIALLFAVGWGIVIGLVAAMLI